jgi:metallo-beta-lactamase family protein
LAVEAHEIYSSDLYDYFDEETLELLKNGVNPIKFPNLRLSVTSDDSVAINLDKTPKIILSASGMCEAGRIRHHLKHNLWRTDSTVLFVGYQSEGTLGRLIIEGAPSVKLFGEEIKVSANIEQLDGISGHADRDMLLGWLEGFTKKPKTVFVNHGNDEVCDEFAQFITEKTGINAIAPFNAAEYDLISGVCLKSGNRQKIVKTGSVKFKESTAFSRLYNAGKRLLLVIEKYRQGANKDIAKFADEVNALSDKWDK